MNFARLIIHNTLTTCFITKKHKRKVVKVVLDFRVPFLYREELFRRILKVQCVFFS
jgi:hypothetical protein